MAPAAVSLRLPVPTTLNTRVAQAAVTATVLTGPEGQSSSGVGRCASTACGQSSAWGSPPQKPPASSLPAGEAPRPRSANVPVLDRQPARVLRAPSTVNSRSGPAGRLALEGTGSHRRALSSWTPPAVPSPPQEAARASLFPERAV